MQSALQHFALMHLSMDVIDSVFSFSFELVMLACKEIHVCIQFSGLIEVTNESGRLEMEVYVKPTDSQQYLYSSSCHQSACKKSIPYVQAMGLKRICSKSCSFERRVAYLCKYLVERCYERNFVQGQINRATEVSRQDALGVLKSSIPCVEPSSC